MWSKVSMGDEHLRYYKHTKFHQNPSSDPKFLVDLTRNDPYLVSAPQSELILDTMGVNLREPPHCQ